MNETFVYMDDVEGAYNSGKVYEGGNMGHRAPIKGGYFPVAPLDQGGDLRSEMLSTIASMGVSVEKHHHEVANSQHELGVKFDSLLKSADGMQIRSEERRVGQEWVRTCRSRGSP